MPSEPEIEILPQKKRKRFFITLCVIFAILLPAMIFYTTGYRLDLSDTDNRIVTTGGLYVTTENLNVDVYLNDDQITRPRLFRSAYYIQNIEADTHRVIVQNEGLHTWVKELPVMPQLVIEAAAFNMPVVPQLRYIPEYVTEADEVVVAAANASSSVFLQGTTTQTFLIATTTATSSYTINPEYDFVASLFSTSTVASTSLMERFMRSVERFGFSTTTPATTTSTVIPEKGRLAIVEDAGELVVLWNGDANNVPYYFCTASSLLETITANYGEHVSQQVAAQRQSTTTPLLADGDRVCRSAIQLDRKQQDVLFYDFLPSGTDLVLMQLEDGLYVTEIDDRSWQNTQRIYAGTDFAVVIDNDNIYIKEDDVYAEILLELFAE